MSDWRAKLRTGSFRGVEFQFRASDNVFGRNVAVHVVPFFEGPPGNEDLGIGPEGFQLELFVLEPGYMSKRDQLKYALLQPGPGTLVHPRVGELQVVVYGQVHVRETTQEGGMAIFLVNFLLDAEPVAPTATTDTQQAAQDQAAATQTAADSQLATNFIANTTALISDAQALLTDAFGTIESVIGNLETAEAQIQAIASLPQQIAARLDADLSLIASLADLQRLFPYNYTGAPANAQALANRAAVSLHVQVSALIAGVVLASQTTFSSYDDALAAKGTLLAQLDAVQASAGDDLFAALEDLRAALAADITARAADLARLTRFTPAAAMPALVIAHRLYGPVDLENSTADLLARNGVEHPAFVPAQIPLEVLTDWAPAP